MGVASPDAVPVTVAIDVEIKEETLGCENNINNMNDLFYQIISYVLV